MKSEARASCVGTRLTALLPRPTASERRRAAIAGLLLLAVPGVVGVAKGQSRWLNEWQLVPNEPTEYDWSNAQVATDSNLVIVAAGASSAEALFAGEVLLFDVTTGQRVGVLEHPDGLDRHRFGMRVDADAGRAIVSSYDTIDGFGAAGAAFVYDLDSRALLHRWRLDTPRASALFGYDVAIDGNLAAVASYEYDAWQDHRGRCYFYDVPSGDLARVVDFGEPSGNGLEIKAIDVSGGLAVIGVHRRKYPGGFAIVVDVATGERVATFVSDEPEAEDGFGAAVAIFDHLVLVGAYLERSLDSQRNGAAYLFDVITGNQVARLVAPEGAPGDLLGWSVALNDRYAVAGAPNSDRYHRRRGAAYLFDVTTGGFISKVMQPDIVSLSHFGWSVAIDARTDALAISAPNAIVNEIECGEAFIAREIPVVLAAALEGQCPGLVAITVSNATPGGQVAFGFSEHLGGSLLTSRACPQLHVDLHPRPLAGTPYLITADATGVARFRSEVPADLCGAVFAQAIDVTTCEVSNLVVIE